MIRADRKTMGVQRLLAAGLCYHVRVQCNNRAFRFNQEEDFSRYLWVLDTCRLKMEFLIHHYVLMHTHVHLIISTPGPVLLNKIMQAINKRYATDYHRRYQRHGHFWINKYKCDVIDSDSYALTCMRYLDRNPMRAGIVQRPQDWPWSAYTYYAYGKTAFNIDPHPTYLGIGNDVNHRMQCYRDFVNTVMPSDERREQDLIKNGLNPRRRSEFRTKQQLEQLSK